MPNQFLKSQSSLNPYWPRELSELDIKAGLALSIGASCPLLIECSHLPCLLRTVQTRKGQAPQLAHKFPPLARPPRSGQKGMIVARQQVLGIQCTVATCRSESRGKQDSQPVIRKDGRAQRTIQNDGRGAGQRSWHTPNNIGGYCMTVLPFIGEECSASHAL